MGTRHGRNKGPRKSALLKRFSAAMVYAPRSPNSDVIEEYTSRAATLRLPHQEVAAELARPSGGYPRDEMAAKVLAGEANVNYHDGRFEGGVKLLSIVLQDDIRVTIKLFHGGNKYMFVRTDKLRSSMARSVIYEDKERAMYAFRAQIIRYETEKKIIDLEKS